MTNDLSYLIPLTLGPAFLAASIYLCLARIVTVYGADLSRLRPRTYTIVFIACDFLSLVLQSVGGALAATSETDADGDTGVRIMVAGLAFQVFSLLLFMALWAEFVWTVRRVPDGRKDQRFEWLRLSFKFKAFQYCEFFDHYELHVVVEMTDSLLYSPLGSRHIHLHSICLPCCRAAGRFRWAHYAKRGRVHGARGPNDHPCYSCTDSSSSGFCFFG